MRNLSFFLYDYIIDNTNKLFFGQNYDFDYESEENNFEYRYMSYKMRPIINSTYFLYQEIKSNIYSDDHQQERKII